MDISGRIILFLGEQSGTSKAGNPWKKKEWVLETFSQYPKKVKFHIFGEKSDTINLEVGKDYTLSFDLESREFQGRWYTDVSVFRAMDYNPAQQMAGGYNQPGGYPSQSSAYPTQPSPMPFGSESQPAYGAQNGNFGQPVQPFSSSSSDNDEDLPF